MKFGLFYLPTYMPDLRDAQTHYQNMIEQVVYADKIGIDYVWMVEHHFVRHGGLIPSNYAFLSYLAARTERIRLGTGATVLPLNDPIRVAEMAATVDQLSKGRFDLGIGRGFLRDEFDAFGVPMRESRERVEDGIKLIKQAWSGRPLTYSSPYRPPVENLPIIPPVYQKPHPPIWVACFMSPESFEWTADEGYNLLYVAYHVDHAVAMERMNWYRARLQQNGRGLAGHEVCCVYHGHFMEKNDPERTRAIVDKAMIEYNMAGVEAATKAPDPIAYKGYGVREASQKAAGFDSYYPNRVLMGGPDQVLARIQTLKDAGVTQLSILVDYGSLAQPEIMKSLEVFGRDILPAARKI